MIMYISVYLQYITTLSKQNTAMKLRNNNIFTQLNDVSITLLMLARLLAVNLCVYRLTVDANGQLAQLDSFPVPESWVDSRESPVYSPYSGHSKCCHGTNKNRTALCYFCIFSRTEQLHFLPHHPGERPHKHDSNGTNHLVNGGVCVQRTHFQHMWAVITTNETRIIIIIIIIASYILIRIVIF